MSKVYLAGGFGSGWRDKVVTNHATIDPEKKEQSGAWDMKSIGEWDKNAIRDSDIVFAYMERTNPSGFGLSAEIGYANSLGKTVVLVLEKGHTIHKDRHLEFLTCFADYVFDSLPDGVKFLNTLP